MPNRSLSFAKIVQMSAKQSSLLELFCRMQPILSKDSANRVQKQNRNHVSAFDFAEKNALRCKYEHPPTAQIYHQNHPPYGDNRHIIAFTSPQWMLWDGNKNGRRIWTTTSSAGNCAPYGARLRNTCQQNSIYMKIVYDYAQRM